MNEHPKWIEALERMVTSRWENVTTVNDAAVSAQ
jgi:hypothetical protein